MTARFPKVALWCSFLALGLGCNHARIVELHSDGGGIVAIPDNSNAWPNRNFNRAEELMAKQCPQGYVIERQGETVIGQVAHTNTETQQHKVPVLTALGLAPPKLESQQTTSYEDQKEWRIWFRPKDATATYAPSDAPPPPLAP